MKKGQVIDGTWVVDRTLGRGGMGSVYRCHNRDSEKIEAAIKVLAGTLRDDPDAVARFVREAEILHRLDHRSVVKVRNVRAESDPPYLEMEYVHGEHLGDVLARGPLDTPAALKLAEQLFGALEYLHGNDVRHRDLKPDNLLLRDENDDLVLVDFGLSLDTAATRLTIENMAFGTVAYAPPEWLKPSEIDPCAWDLYAGGVLLWEMLTGKEPFPASGEGAPRQQALQVMLGKQNAPPLDPGAGFPPSLRKLVQDLTWPDPARRPRTATEVLSRLAQVRLQLDAGWDTAAGAERQLETVDEARVDTQVPPPFRARSSQAIQVIPPDEGVPVWAQALLAAVALGLVVAGGWYVSSLGSERDPMLADIPNKVGQQVEVELVLQAEVRPERLAIAVDGRLPESVEDGVARFRDVGVGPQTVQWAYGEGCALNSCPGAACPAWCGSGQLVIELDGQANPARMPLKLTVPEREVSVLVKSLENPRKGPFKKDPPPPWGYLAGAKGRAEGSLLRFAGIQPGEHKLIVAMGSCPAEAKGCTKDGTCPAGCASEFRTVRIGWEEGPLALTSDLPPPQ